MTLRNTKFWLVQSISLSRLFAALLFAWLAFRNVPLIIVSGLYLFAMVSDLIDGYLSRKLRAETYFGKVIDLVADKSLTTVSLLYAAARGIDVLPLAVIATRDIVMIGMRLVIAEGTQLLPTNRMMGGLIAFLLWGNTLVLIHARTAGELIRVSNVIYWVCSIVFAVNLVVRVYVSAWQIRAASTDDH